ncbi:hypothetical protein PVAP13_5KG757380 [Panicum virgatum]|uniref:Secreted protein n=1 Tax=Panicum virgatum TaxID=38727 RepID=A0A8T0SX20_PANVG|nr:hypothetical protein PVAP13_5KG757380 [Panicum virgatum]
MTVFSCIFRWLACSSLAKMHQPELKSKMKNSSSVKTIYIYIAAWNRGHLELQLLVCWSYSCEAHWCWSLLKMVAIASADI